MPLRPDEEAAANALVAALQAEEVVPLPAFPTASWTESPTDPPDLLVNLGDQTVGVELGRVIDPEYAKTTAEMLRGALSGPDVWTPDVDAGITDLFTKKATAYKTRGISVDWLLLHESMVERPGYFDCGHEGHRELRQVLARVLAAGPFSRVLFQSSWRRREWWSVIYADDGQMIETRLQARQREWEEYVAEHIAQVSDRPIVAHIGEVDDFPRSGSGVIVFQDSTFEITTVLAVEAQPRVELAGRWPDSGYCVVWIPLVSATVAGQEAHEIEEKKSQVSAALKRIAGIP